MALVKFAPRVDGEWRSLTVHAAYEINEFGAIKRVLGGCGARVGRVLKMFVSAENGYPFVNLWIDGKRRAQWLHILVAKAFLGPKPFDGAEVRHIDGIKRNIQKSNLVWGSKLDNEADKESHGTRPRGEEVHNAILCEKDVLAIRAAYGTETLVRLGARYGVMGSTIYKIGHRQRWGHVQAEAAVPDAPSTTFGVSESA